MMRSSSTAPEVSARPPLSRRALRRARSLGPDRAKRSAKLAISAVVYGVDAAIAAVRPAHRRGTRSCGVVLMYHDVAAEHAARFAAQCDDIVRFARPSRLGDMHDLDGTWKVAVTFDDGFRSFADVALPELEARAIPSTMFVATEWAERSAREPHRDDGWPVPMTPDELAALPASVELASHSRTHAHLPQLDDDALADELVGSRQELKRMTGRAVRYHAFPYGEHDERVDREAQRAGYERCYGIVPTETRPSDGFIVGRVQVDPTDWRVEFRLKVLGAYRWMGWWMLAKDRMRSRPSNGAIA